MAVNLGSTAVNAVIELRGNRDFERMLEGMGDFVQTQMQRAMDAPVDTRVDQTAHARGMYDVWEGMHAAFHDLRPAQVKQPSMSRRLREGVNGV